MTITQSLNVLTIGKVCSCANQTLCFVLVCWGNQGTPECHCSGSLVTVQQDSWERKWGFELLEHLIMCSMKSIISCQFFHRTSLLKMSSAQCLEEGAVCGQYSIEKLLQNEYWKYVIFTLVFHFHSCCLISLLLFHVRGRQEVLERKRNSCCVQTGSQAGREHCSEMMSVELSGEKLQLFCWAS